MQMLRAGIVDLVFAELERHGAPALPNYADALSKACREAPPPFGMAWYGDVYRSRATDPSWIADSLVANAAKEGEGSAKLWQLAGATRNHTTSDLVREHAVDESRHARFYISMLELAFPEVMQDVLVNSLYALSPGYSSTTVPPVLPEKPEVRVYDDLIQMNIGEIRTLIHQLLMRPVLLLHCPEANRARLQRLLDALREDEARHILYTGNLIDQFYVRRKQFVEDVMIDRLREFNRITIDEIGDPTLEFS